MRPFSPRMYPHLAYILPASESTDADAGVAESFPDVSGLTPVPCRIRQLVTNRETSNDQSIGVTRAEVSFPADPGVVKGSVILRDSGRPLMRCLGACKDRAVGFNFTVTCEVIE